MLAHALTATLLLAQVGEWEEINYNDKFPDLQGWETKVTGGLCEIKPKDISQAEYFDVISQEGYEAEIKKQCLIDLGYWNPRFNVSIPGTAGLVWIFEDDGFDFAAGPAATIAAGAEIPVRRINPDFQRAGKRIVVPEEASFYLSIVAALGVSVAGLEFSDGREIQISSNYGLLVGPDIGIAWFKGREAREFRLGLVVPIFAGGITFAGKNRFAVGLQPGIRFTL